MGHSSSALIWLFVVGFLFGVPCAPADAQGWLGDSAALREVQTQLEAMRQAQTERESRQARVAAELNALDTQREVLQTRLRQRARALYRLGRAGHAPMHGGLDSLLRFRARLGRLERMVSRDVASIRRMRHRQQSLRGEDATLRQEMDVAGRELRALGERRARLDVSQQRLESFDALFSNQPSPVQASNPERLHQGIRVHDLSGFASHRGRLSMPLSGQVSGIREAMREGRAGLEMSAQVGASVQNVGFGRIVFADRHPAYGRMIIVDHGERYFSVYGGLASISVRVGQQIANGRTLGAVGTNGLFFQMRQGTRPLDAADWLGL